MPVMTDADRLAEALDVRHQLMLGQKVVSISSAGGKSLTYSQANLPLLDQYIAQLRRNLGLPTGYGAPITPIF
ncbi:MAG: hypothetical protein KIS73_24725 [Enhydrobacter sp.]|nr:hypothetical protein [Enhydrobacter sp.]